MTDNKNSISVIVPSIKPELWDQVIKNCTSKSVSVEIIFVGPKNCDYELPEGVKYIKTDFKVTQCLQIALVNSTGYYILQTADDQLFTGSEDPLGDLVKYANKHQDKFLSIPNAYNGVRLNPDETNLVPNNPETSVPFILILPKNIIENVGGYNANYIGSYADVDLYLRIRGLNLKDEYFIDNIIVSENRTPGENLGLLSFRYLGHDIKYLKYNWVEYNEKKDIYFLRNKSYEEFLPFDNRYLMTTEQGAGTAKIYKTKFFINLMKNKYCRYLILFFYKFYRKFILRSKFY
jgi:hypothetical protein